MLTSRIPGPDSGRGRDASPRLRDTLTREFLIRDGIAHAKAAKAGKEYRGGDLIWDV